MAGFHYKLQIVPGNFQEPIDEEYWIDVQPDPEMLESFRTLLPLDKSWGETEEYRSGENYSVLYIWWENSKVWSLAFEYAPVVGGDDILLRKILQLCDKYKYKLYSESTGRVVEPERDSLWRDFKDCRVYKIYERQGLMKFG